MGQYSVRVIVRNVRSSHARYLKNHTKESYHSLDRVPPIVTLQTGSEALHTLLGYDRRRHILSMSVRDPLDGRDMPVNGRDHISAQCIRGVRKVDFYFIRRKFVLLIHACMMS